MMLAPPPRLILDDQTTVRWLYQLFFNYFSICFSIFFPMTDMKMTSAAIFDQSCMIEGLSESTPNCIL